MRMLVSARHLRATCQRLLQLRSLRIELTGSIDVTQTTEYSSALALALVLPLVSCAPPDRSSTANSTRACRHVGAMSESAASASASAYRDLEGRWVLVGRHAYRCPCGSGLTPEGAADSAGVGGASEAADIAGSGEGAEIAGAAEGASVAGAGEAAGVAGRGEDAEIGGSAEGAGVAGDTEGADVAGAAEGADVAGGSEGSALAGASDNATVAGSAEGAEVAGSAASLACRTADGPLGFRLVGTGRPAYYVEAGVLYRVRGARADRVE